MGKLKEIIIGNLTIHKTFELAMSSIEEEILKHYIPISEVEEIRKEDMKKKFEEHCGEYRLSNQDGLFIDWQMDFFDKYYIPISEIKEGSYEDGYLDGFEKGKGVVMGTTDCIPIDEIKILIAREITIANSEGQPTSRLTSLYGKLPIDKSKEEDANE